MRAGTADYDLVKRGFFDVAVDHVSSVSPSDPGQLRIEEGGGTIISVTWNLAPGKDEGGDNWRWGQIRGFLSANEAAYDCRKVRLELTYSATTPITVVLFQSKPRGIEEGSEHAMTLVGTGGRYKTVLLDLNRFRQPHWTDGRVRLNLKELQGIGFLPVLPAGGECKLKIKSCEFINLSERKVL